MPKKANKKTYKALLKCNNNCETFTEVEIPKGKTVHDWLWDIRCGKEIKCGNCGCYLTSAENCKFE